MKRHRDTSPKPMGTANTSERSSSSSNVSTSCKCSYLFHIPFHLKCVLAVEYRVGQLYEPSILPDYGGKLFQQQGCMLVQHEVLDMDRKIIPPWEQYSALRTGTLVMATITLHCYIMKMRNLHGEETGRERKVSFICL